MSGFNTSLLHDGVDDYPNGATLVPIYQSSAFKHESAEELERIFDNKAMGFSYTRINNPTIEAFEKRITKLEKGFSSVACSSGMAAIFNSIANIVRQGDEVVASCGLYGGTVELFEDLESFGITVKYVADNKPECFEELITDKTRVVFAETIGNPKLDVTDIKAVADVAHAHGIPLIVDNTFATPVNCRPFEWGADIVTHSTTKYMDGHAVALGGCIVDSGNFDWEAHADRYPGLTTPDESYHGIIYTKKFGRAAYITKATSQLMRDLGSMQSPQNAFLLNLGLESLALRVRKHCENADKVAEYLNNNDKVAWVNYAGLPGNRYYDLARKYMPDGICGVISFGLKGGRDTAVKFMDSLKLVAIVTHVADARTSVLHPASHTHRQMTDEQLIEAGVQPDLIRLSVGIENADDIIADIEQALTDI